MLNEFSFFVRWVGWMIQFNIWRSLVDVFPGLRNGRNSYFRFSFTLMHSFESGRFKYIECELFSKAGNYIYNLFMYVMIKQLIQVFFLLFSYLCFCSLMLLVLLVAVLYFAFDSICHCEVYFILYDILHYGIMDWSRAFTLSHRAHLTAMAIYNIWI